MPLIDIYESLWWNNYGLGAKSCSQWHYFGLGINQPKLAWLRAGLGSRCFNCSMSALSTWLHRLEKAGASSLPLPAGPQRSSRLFEFTPRLPRPRIVSLTFPFASAALHVGAFNSLAINARIQISCFISPDWPISWELIINVLQEHHVSCWGVHMSMKDSKPGQLHQML